jgi:LCP family protein required for cell wall assembly
MREYSRQKRNPGRLAFSCALIFLPLLCLCFVSSLYFLAPGRTNILLLGIDYSDPSGNLSRTDTMILATFLPDQPYVGLLSIPRDLWVTLPGGGENRINTAHFFAEAAHPGSGPGAALETVRSNFRVNVQYYVRMRFEGFRNIVDALGGVDIRLPEDMAGYPAGFHHLTGNKALAFVRNRSNSDDFFRMQHTQLMIKAIYTTAIKPGNWIRLPAVFNAATRSIDTNIPAWLWPRLALTFLRVGPDNIDGASISRELVIPFTTSEGASVLAPRWEKIYPLVEEMFGQ